MDQTARYLFIVSRDEPDLYDYLKREFATDKEVEVITDRRAMERRQRAQPYEPDRRRGERRSRPDVQHDLRTLGFVIVKRAEASPTA